MIPIPDRILTLRDADFGYGLVPWAKGPLWELTRDYKFTVSMRGGFPVEYLIPAGYQFDKASVPSVFWGWPMNYTPSGKGELAALEHDYLCDLLNGGSEWLRGALGEPLPEPPEPDVVHEHFQRRLAELGVRPGKARMMGLAVKLFGPKGKLRLGRYL